MRNAIRGLLVLTAVALLLPANADGASAYSGNLKAGSCHVRDFRGSGTFNAAVTHNSNKNDMYQIVCDADTCWAFSFNTGNGGTMLTTGLTDDNWEWWVCAWAHNAGRTKYQAIASMPGDDFRLTGPADAVREIDLNSPDAPRHVVEAVARLEQRRHR